MFILTGKHLTAMIDLDKIRKHVLLKLEDNLPPHLTYHSVGHTNDVLKQAVVIAEEEGITSRSEILLLQVGALYHDAGFVAVYNGHEEKGCEIATEELAQFGLGTDDISTICSLIMATKMPQSPQTILEKIICDADLDYLGRGDYYMTSENLYHEALHEGLVRDEHEWTLQQVSFLEKHRYFTGTSRLKREPLKQQHLEELKKKVDPGG